MMTPHSRLVYGRRSLPLSFSVRGLSSSALFFSNMAVNFSLPRFFSAVLFVFTLFLLLTFALYVTIITIKEVK